MALDVGLGRLWGPRWRQALTSHLRPVLEGSGRCDEPVEVIGGCGRSCPTRRKANSPPRFISPTVDPPSELTQGREEVIVPGSKDGLIL